ncbi:MAG: sulfatase [Pirellulaceae bacterium]|jgi:arylsulfatase A|nr:sulfatase [Pirellulaceae bacterium]
MVMAKNGFVFVVFVCCLAYHSACASQPNIVFIMADDLGYGDLACYGSAVHHTPHLDALAAAGMRFTDFHSSGPMCTPTRAAALTGLYQQRFGSQFDTALSGVDDRDLGLPHEAVTIAEVLKPLGYSSACFGKWHLGYLPPWLPTSQGFDQFRGLASGDGDFHTHIDRSGSEDWWHNDQIEMTEGYTTDLLTQYSIDFIEQHRSQPFFLYVPHLAIHFPWQGPEDPPHRRKGMSYETDKWGVIPNPGNVAPHVKAMIESLDESVGKIVAALRKHDLQNNTLVIFTSDNGGYLTYGPNFRNISSNGPYRGQKTQLYEGGHRVPAIFTWPGKIQPSVSTATTHSIDLFPTIAALAGIETEGVRTDGHNLVPLLTGEASLPERMLFWRAHSRSAVRSGSWKLHRDGDKTELYDLDHDPGEQHDLAAQQPERVNRLIDAWNEWEADVSRSIQELQ